MGNTTPNDAVWNEAVPLCFDTCAIHGSKTGKRLLEKIRERFPQRRLLIPSWVVAERARQFRVELGERFDPDFIAGFLMDKDLNIDVPPFDREIALGGWLSVVGKFSNEQWRWEGQPKNDIRPCAQRCRTGDHIVYAFSVAHGALLVTGDCGLLKQINEDQAKPGAIHVNDLKKMVGFREP